MSELPDKKYLRPDEVAEYYEVNVKTVYNWASTGKIDSVKIGGMLRFEKESVEKVKQPVIV
ncbi:MAG: helix-turn-helix domain-containing protein [Patescibacteria group bacterium]|jgi:excisionase family DNA binding protein